MIPSYGMNNNHKNKKYFTLITEYILSLMPFRFYSFIIKDKTTILYRIINSVLNMKK